MFLNISIPHSSLSSITSPVHKWWNMVFPDYGLGPWSFHLLPEGNTFLFRLKPFGCLRTSLPHSPIYGTEVTGEVLEDGPNGITDLWIYVTYIITSVLSYRKPTSLFVPLPTFLLNLLISPLSRLKLLSK